jgi:hypothetical protein
MNRKYGKRHRGNKIRISSQIAVDKIIDFLRHRTTNSLSGRYPGRYPDRRKQSNRRGSKKKYLKSGRGKVRNSPIDDFSKKYLKNGHFLNEARSLSDSGQEIFVKSVFVGRGLATYIFGLLNEEDDCVDELKKDLWEIACLATKAGNFDQVRFFVDNFVEYFMCDEIKLGDTCVRCNLKKLISLTPNNSNGNKIKGFLREKRRKTRCECD